MKLSDLPADKFPIPFAKSAGGGYIRTVPEASQIGITNGAASLTDGFPPLNFLPVGSGGVPPFGQDMNGILHQVTLWTQWQNAGAMVVYDSSFSTAIGGYPIGAIVSSATTPGIVWLCTADDNTSNPDTGGANWVSFATSATPSKGGLIATRVFTASGTYTPTAGTNRIIVTVTGGGGGGGGCTATGASTFAAGGGGAGAATIISELTSGFSGAAMIIGLGGTGVSGGNGNNGAASSFGALSAPGGGGGSVGNAVSAPAVSAGGVGALASSGNLLNNSGASGGLAITFSGSNSSSGPGGASYWGAGARAQFSTSLAGASATNYGSGGGGGVLSVSAGANAGGNGAPGVITIEEYA